MGMPLHDICCFSLSTFNILSLCLIFVNFINMCLGMFLFEFIIYGTLWASWIWMTISFLILGKFSMILLQYFLKHFPFLFFWEAYNSDIRMVIGVPQVSVPVIFFFSFFFLYSALLYLCPPFYLPGHLLFFCPSYSAISSL